MTPKRNMSCVKGELKDIQDFLRCLGIRKRIFETSLALKCTLTGLKTSFLWDTSLPPSPTALLGLQALCEIAEVRFVPFLYKEIDLFCKFIIQVLILFLQGDTIVTTRGNLQKLLNDLKKSPPVFVGFGDSEGQPILVNMTLEEREGVLRIVENMALSKDKVVDVEVDGLNLSCLVGIILGFPVIYNFPDQVCNPLGNLDLVIFKIEVSLDDPQKHPVTPISFSIPQHLMAEEEVVQQLNFWWTNMSGGQPWAKSFTSGELTISLSQHVQNLPSLML